MRKRKLFCQISPLCFKISIKKEILLRNTKDLFKNYKIAKTISKDELPVVIKSHRSVLVRNLYGVDVELQKNKVTNIILACNKLNGLIIKPNEVFSFWSIVGDITKQDGYKDGLIINPNGIGKGLGGGLCQMSNMIHLLVVHSPLLEIELHHHGLALFPDERRNAPFGTGTSICYNNVDYRFKNTLDQNVQLLLWVEDGELLGELRCEKPLENRYKLIEKNHHYKKREDRYYRISQVYRQTISKDNNEVVKEELLVDNDAEVMYDYSLIPIDEIE